MAKSATIFVCSNCGNESPKWFGKCPSCNEWNTCYEERQVKSSNKKSTTKIANVTSLNTIKKDEIIRNSTGFEELDRVLRRWVSKRFINTFRRRTRNRKIHFNFANMR